jgi:Predicted metal-binding integral membrane protein (DUF2182)
MSMAWMRMPGETWPGAAASFLGMWIVMMVAMMLPSLVPMLWRYRRAVGRTGKTRLGRLTALVGMGYFFVWTVSGMAIFPLGAVLAEIEMQQAALAPVHRVEGASPCLLPGGTGVRLYVAGGRRHGVATGRGLRTSLREQLCQSNGGPARDRGHGPARDGCGDLSHHPRTSRTCERAPSASHWSGRCRGRVGPDRASNRARMTHPAWYT